MVALASDTCWGNASVAAQIWVPHDITIPGGIVRGATHFWPMWLDVKHPPAPTPTYQDPDVTEPTVDPPAPQLENPPLDEFDNPAWQPVTGSDDPTVPLPGPYRDRYAPKWPYPPLWDPELLWRAINDPEGGHIPNRAIVDKVQTSQPSPGGSFILKYILGTLPVPAARVFSEVRTAWIKAPDGSWIKNYGHGPGNAIDVSGRGGVTGYRKPTVQNHADMVEIGKWLNRYPQLFTSALFSARPYPLGPGSISLRDGESFDWPDPNNFNHQDHLHLEATREWLLEVLRPELWLAQIRVGGVSPTPDRLDPKRGRRQATPATGLNKPPIVTTTLDVTDEGENHIFGVARIPNGFSNPDYAGGLAVTYRQGRVKDAFGDSRDDWAVGVHKRRGTPKAYETGWRTLHVERETQWGIIAAQRLGEYVYALTVNRRGPTNFAQGSRFNSTKFVERRDDQQGIALDGMGPATHGFTVPFFRPTVLSQMHVSDHYPPRLWLMQNGPVSDTIEVGYWVDNGTRWAMQYEFNPGLEADPEFTPEPLYRWQYFHYRQLYSRPVDTFGPALVHPWRAGVYGPPELWWFVLVRLRGGGTNGLLRIHRAQWGAGNFREDAGVVERLEDASANFNPQNHAFSHEWGVRPKSTYVGAVGPFRGVTWEHVDRYSSTFQVIRDPVRKNRLWLAYMRRANTSQSHSEDTTLWNAAWTAVSNDDGATWGRPRQMSPWVRGDEAEADVGPYAPPNGSVAIIGNGDLIAPITYMRKGKANQAMAIINHGSRGISDVERRSTIYRRGESARGTWLS